MQFERNEKTKKWHTTRTVQEREIEVRVDVAHSEDRLEEIAGQWLEKVDQNWRQIEKNLIDNLLEIYNDDWTDPDEGYPELSSKQFLKKVNLQTIDVQADEQSARLYFSDSGIFSKHKVEIRWTGEEMEDATVKG